MLNFKNKSPFKFCCVSELKYGIPSPRTCFTVLGLQIYEKIKNFCWSDKKPASKNFKDSRTFVHVYKTKLNNPSFRTINLWKNKLYVIISSKERNRYLSSKVLIFMLLDCIASDNKILTYYIRLLLTLLNSSSDYSLIIKMRSAINIIL